MPVDIPGAEMPIIVPGVCSNASPLSISLIVLDICYKCHNPKHTTVGVSDRDSRTYCVT